MSELPANIGPYEITREIGRGGMGVVYLARDTKLDRDVAIKALPEEVAEDADRLARFEREAKTLAALNHPHIASIYGLEEADGRQYLILEFVPGETLDTRLGQGAIPVAEALPLARQIAEAIEAAHEKGVIHRDLKPANIKFADSGGEQVKVLDFGLAKALEAGTASTTAATLEHSPTVVGSPTVAGVILGTAGYMSPEQARGRPVDKRSDIFSFGVILFEMLTGRRAFGGETVTDSLGAIVHMDPDWDALPSDTPPTIQLLLHRCLTKDRKRRLQDIGDARVEIEEAIADPTSSRLSLAGAAASPPSSRRGVLVAIAVIFFVLGLGVMTAWFKAGERQRVLAPPDPPIAFEIDVSELGQLRLSEESPEVVVSDDGRVIAFRFWDGEESGIAVRRTDSDEVRMVAAARDGSAPFLSPDGQMLGFWRDNKLMKAPVAGGPATSICEAPSPSGSVAWLESGEIVFVPYGGDPVLVVPAAGGPPRILTRADRETVHEERSQLIHGFEHVCSIPGRRAVLVSGWDGNSIEDYDIVHVDLETGRVTHIIDKAAQPNVVGDDGIVFLRDSSLLAVRFDFDALRSIGEPRVVLEGVRTNSWGGVGQYDVGPSGTLAYVSGRRLAEGRRLMRVDREGNGTPISEPDAIAGYTSVAPDGAGIALATLRRQIELWLFDPTRRTMTLISNQGESHHPVFSPDGREVAFQRILAEEGVRIVARSFGGSDEVRSLFRPTELFSSEPLDWSPDGRWLLLRVAPNGNHDRQDLFVLDLETEGPPQAFVESPYDINFADISPDGRWVAFDSNESGRREIYVTAFPGGGRKWQVSAGGGWRPRWSRAGDEIFFIHETELHAASFTLTEEGEPRFGTPRMLFDMVNRYSLDAWSVYDVFPEGDFLMVEPAPWERDRADLNVVVNWRTVLQRSLAD